MSVKLDPLAYQWYDVKLWDPGNVAHQRSGQLRLSSAIGGDQVSLENYKRNGFSIVGTLTALDGDHPTSNTVYVGIAESPGLGDTVSMALTYDGLRERKVPLNKDREFHWAFFNTLFIAQRGKPENSLDKFNIIISGEPQ